MTQVVEEVKEPTVAEKALLAQGVKPENLSDGQADTVNTGKKPTDQGNNPVLTDEEKAKIAEADAATKAAEDAAAKKKADEEAAKPLTEYTKFQDPNAQAAVDLLKEAGVTPEEANAIFNKAVESGNLEDIDWKALEAKVGATKALLIRNGVEKYHAEGFAASKATEAKVYEILGSKENWAAVKAWSNKLAASDPAHAAVEAEIRRAIDMNGFIAEAAVNKLKGLYEADKNNSSLTTTSVLLSGDTVTVSAGDALSRADYNKELKALHAKGRVNPAEEAALHARRKAGMARGI